MGDSGGKFFEATLPVGNLGAEQILVVAIERFAFQVFVRSVSDGHGGPRQNVLDPSTEARLFLLRCM